MIERDYATHPNNIFEPNTLYWHMGCANYYRYNTSKAVIFRDTESTLDRKTGNYRVFTTREAHEMAVKLIREKFDTHIVVSGVTNNFTQGKSEK